MTLDADAADLVSCLNACLFDTEWHNSSFVSDVVMLPFDPENECCFCPRGWCVCVFFGGDCFSLSPLCLLRTTQPLSSGPWDPKSLDVRGLWDAPCSSPTFSQDCFSLIMCCQLTDWWNNYGHLVQQICKNMWKGQWARRSGHCEWVCVLTGENGIDGYFKTQNTFYLNSP